MTDEKATLASDNVFADLGFENPEEEMLKAKLVREIRAVIKSRRLTQTKAATLAKVSRDGKLDAIKPAFLEVGGACKACHDKFRNEEKK